MEVQRPSRVFVKVWLKYWEQLTGCRLGGTSQVFWVALNNGRSAGTSNVPSQITKKQKLNINECRQLKKE